MANEKLQELTTSVWSEKVYIETTEHIIKGCIFMPKIGKKNRLLSEVLNGNKHFLAVKDCSLEFKLIPNKEVEKYNFLQVNIASILIMRPLNED